MIIMLNGSFGVGKTSVAEELQRRLPNLMLYDPEIVGMMLKYITSPVRRPKEDTDDFQDITLWPTLSVVTARYIHRLYHKHLIVPMTIANPAYLKKIRNGLARISPPLYHFCLTAPLPVIEQRLAERVASGDNIEWSWQKAQQYAPLFIADLYRVQIDTSQLTISETADEIERNIANGVGVL